MSQSELSGRQSSASALYHCRERFFVVHRKVCQYASIQRHISPLEAIDQTAVGQPVSTRLRVDTGDPQRAELALALPTIAIGILPCFGDSPLLWDVTHTLKINTRHTREKMAVKLPNLAAA